MFKYIKIIFFYIFKIIFEINVLKNFKIYKKIKFFGYTIFKFNFDFLSGAVTSNTIQQRNLQGSFDNFILMLPALHNKEQQKAALHSSQGIAFYSILYISTLLSSSLYRRTIGRYGSHSFMPSLQLFRFSSLSFLSFHVVNLSCPGTYCCSLLLHFFFLCVCVPFSYSFLVIISLLCEPGC